MYNGQRAPGSYQGIYAGYEEPEAFGSWLSSAISAVTGVGKKIEQVIRAPANAIISLIPGGSAAIAAANAIKPVWDKVTGQIVNPQTGAPVTDADVAAGVVDAAALLRAQEAARQQTEASKLGAFNIPTPVLYGGLGLLAYLAVSGRRRNPPRRRRSRR